MIVNNADFCSESYLFALLPFSFTICILHFYPPFSPCLFALLKFASLKLALQWNLLPLQFALAATMPNHLITSSRRISVEPQSVVLRVEERYFDSFFFSSYFFFTN